MTDIPPALTPTLTRLAGVFSTLRHHAQEEDKFRLERDRLFAELDAQGVPKTGPNGIEVVVKGFLRELGWPEAHIAAAHVSTGTVRQGIDRVT